MNYTPPAIYSLPDAFANRVCNQGLLPASAIIAAEIPAAITAGDTVSTAAFRSYVAQIGPGATGSAAINLSAVVAMYQQSAVGNATMLALRISAHATDP